MPRFEEFAGIDSMGQQFVSSDRSRLSAFRWCVILRDLTLLTGCCRLPRLASVSRYSI